MRGFTQLTWTELKLFLREPAAVFFTLAFPLLLLFVFGGIFGNEPTDWMDNLGSVDISVPGYTGLIVGTTAFMSIPIIISEYRHQGIFRRLRATPLNPMTIIAAQTLIYLVVTLMGLALLYVAGRLVYDLKVPEHPFALILVIVIGFLCLAAMGFLIGSYFKTSRTTQVVGNIVYFPQMFLAGAAMPREMFSDTLRTWTEWLPMTQTINLTKQVWWGEPFSWWSLVYLLAIALVCVAISSRIFKWE